MFIRDSISNYAQQQLDRALDLPEGYPGLLFCSCYGELGTGIGDIIPIYYPNITCLVYTKDQFGGMQWEITFKVHNTETTLPILDFYFLGIPPNLEYHAWGAD